MWVWINTYYIIQFLGGWTSIYQLFWCSPGVQVLTHCHVLFPTSLCGVLLFGSASRPPPPPPAASRPSPSCQHTTCPHTTWHRRSLTHNLSYLVIIQLAHTQLVSVAGVALGDMDLHFAWLTYNLLTHNMSTHNLLTHNLSSHNLTSTFTLRGRRGTWRHAPSLCLAGVAGVALGDMYLHLVTSTLTLRGKRGTYGTGPALVTRRVPKWRRGRRGSLRGRRGTWWHRLSLCVASVALGDMDLYFAWQVWHLAITLRGRRGTWRHRRLLWVAGVALTALGRLWWRAGFTNHAVAAAALCVAGVALGDIDCHFAWQAWHLATWTFTWQHVSSLGDICVAGVALTALGRLWWRAGFPNDAVAAAGLCVASVALGDIDAYFAWQAWHLRHWACSGDALVSQMTPWPPRLFAWQAWRLVTSTLTLRGRRGTYGTGPALVARRVPKWRRGRRGSLRGRRVTWRHVSSLGDIDCHFAWQAALGDIHLRCTWHAWYLVTSTGHVPLLHHLHFCVHCDMFVLDKIVVPASSVAIWHHIYIYASKCIHTSIHPYMHTYIHTCILHNLSIHNLLVLTLPHATCSTPILHHLFSLSCFPHAIFTYLLLLVGRNWHYW